MQSPTGNPRLRNNLEYGWCNSYVSHPSTTASICGVEWFVLNKVTDSNGYSIIGFSSELARVPNVAGQLKLETKVYAS